MFEMRWVKRFEEDLKLGKDICVEIKVLQYRQMTQSDEESAWPTTRWTEWKDVPVVEEE